MPGLSGFSCLMAVKLEQMKDVNIIPMETPVGKLAIVILSDGSQVRYELAYKSEFKGEEQAMISRWIKEIPVGMHKGNPETGMIAHVEENWLMLNDRSEGKRLAIALHL